MAAEVQYASREAVKRALDVAETARADAQIDRAIASASRHIEGRDLLNRRFYPWMGTRYFDWPASWSDNATSPWQVWPDEHEIISVTGLTIAGTAVSSPDFLLRPSAGPPYAWIEGALTATGPTVDTTAVQNAVAVTGTFGYPGNDAPSGALAEALDASETGVDVTDSSAIGVGSIVKADSERMIVTARLLLDTTQDLAGAPGASAAETGVAVTSGAAFAVGETITVDAETMLIDKIAGNTLIVRRAWDGTVLAAHSSGASVYAPRTLVVERGALGTTAATHSTSTALYRHEPPSLVQSLAVAQAIVTVQQEQAAYARTVGSGEMQREAAGRALRDIRDQAIAAYRREPSIVAR